MNSSDSALIFTTVKHVSEVAGEVIAVAVTIIGNYLYRRFKERAFMNDEHICDSCKRHLIQKQHFK